METGQGNTPETKGICRPPKLYISGGKGFFCFRCFRSAVAQAERAEPDHVEFDNASLAIW
jgi:hypothetical protein